MTVLDWARRIAAVTDSVVTPEHTMITVAFDGMQTSIRIGNEATFDDVGEIIERYKDRARQYARIRAEISREGSAA